jgi:hypothetical protein
VRTGRSGARVDEGGGARGGDAVGQAVSAWGASRKDQRA